MVELKDGKTMSITVERQKEEEKEKEDKKTKKNLV
ncbi:hypothetical protein AAIR98_000047 [Elusimicrobium simillimum]